MTGTGKITVERLGGLAGFGGPESALKSVGSLDLADLTAGDLERVNMLFSGVAPAESAGADGFRYKLTRLTRTGSQSVEVPTDSLPPSVTSVVKDGFA